MKRADEAACKVKPTGMFQSAPGRWPSAGNFCLPKGVKNREPANDKAAGAAASGSSPPELAALESTIGDAAPTEFHRIAAMDTATRTAPLPVLGGRGNE